MKQRLMEMMKKTKFDLPGLDLTSGPSVDLKFRIDF